MLQSPCARFTYSSRRQFFALNHCYGLLGKRFAHLQFYKITLLQSCIKFYKGALANSMIGFTSLFGGFLEN